MMPLPGVAISAAGSLTLADIDRLTGGRPGTFDVPCPLCGPHRRTPANRRRRVLRVWQFEPRFATYHCCRCGDSGYSRDETAPRPDPVKLARARQEAGQRHREAAAERLRFALWLWPQRKPIAGTPAERYLRLARGYGGPLPATLGFLPQRGEHGPAMIAAFGLADEIEPGVIAIRDDAIRGVHLTRLLPDGSDRERADRSKIMIGFSTGSPIVLAAPNDLLGQAIVEGVEDGLSIHEATGLGVWAAGCASRLPALAAAVPSYIDCVTAVADADDAGQRYAGELIAWLNARRIDAHMVIPGASSWRAAR